MSTMTRHGSATEHDQATVREVLDAVRAEGRSALSAPEAKRVCDAYGIAVPGEGLATSPGEAVGAGRRHRLSGRAEDRLAGHPPQDGGQGRARRLELRGRRRGRLRDDRRERQRVQVRRRHHRRPGAADAVRGPGAADRRRDGPELRADHHVRHRRRARRGAARRHVPARADLARGRAVDARRDPRRRAAARRPRPAGRRPRRAGVDDRRRLGPRHRLPGADRGRPQPGPGDPRRRHRRRRALRRGGARGGARSATRRRRSCGR